MANYDGVHGFRSDNSKYYLEDLINDGILDTGTMADDIIETVMNGLYPDGSIFMTADDNLTPESENWNLPGYWVKIEGSFLLATANGEEALQTGGNSQITLTQSQCALPSHTHSHTLGAKIPNHEHLENANVAASPVSGQTKINGKAITSYFSNSTTASPAKTMLIFSHYRTDGGVKTHKDGGGGSCTMSGAISTKALDAQDPVDIMPPYTTVHVWRRDDSADPGDQDVSTEPETVA